MLINQFLFLIKPRLKSGVLIIIFDFQVVMKFASVLFFVFMVIFSFAANSSAEVKTQRVFKNVFVSSPIDDSGKSYNTTFVITPKGVIVIDPGGTPQHGKDVFAEIKKRTDQPIKAVINTSYLGKSTFANQVFQDADLIISHRNAQKALAGRKGERHLEETKSMGTPDWDTVKLFPPNFSFKKEIDLFYGGFLLEAKHAEPSLTNGDTFIFLPEHKAIITGGLVLNNEFPDLSSSLIESWIKNLYWMEDLDVEIVIPGTGEIGFKPIIIQWRHYFIDLKYYVTKMISDGKPIEEIVSEALGELSTKYGHWKRKDLLEQNIRRAYNEYKPEEKPGAGKKAL
jgi:glyoxylase-like metal-dependent hydrolase (beta-lactamase superfamily II)